MLDLILYQPEIPPNTGNIIRLCANTGARLHLIHPLGFLLTERELKRAGMDYRSMVDISEHSSFESFLESARNKRVIAFSTKGKKPYTETLFEEGDGLLFGPETRGLPEKVLDSSYCKEVVRVPMKKNSRSLNLSNTVSVVVYEAMRQLGFPGLA
ncbi:MAG: tRNA (uridine(34)/cytosine(34)/5-carboxymethylaminomethyluridine(34)-2'-O)-methyltransferase TrmL [Gammaproteobacteria bacterium]|jgi:tRNA (cytidine/uridine-2'-O-)-methyltransferase|nr:tRNA (uridine(34)/cytosine(34)/5-carboxymethylaminomethyluridine(34)-2'-O)-methyltransferase TrmL [Gammaproteobacteria bacterium]|tara:strand:+ start:3045 stop:3509 length:465 start_codon:yes stop_codon:yes gene_type:complete